jgi:UDP-3-O-acyl N-acetylglucosamine deacetylase
VRKLSSRRQRTIARTAEARGVGYLTGANIRLRFVPAPPSTGVVFVRTDLNPPLHVPATLEQVTGTNRRTTLGHLPRGVSLVEHVLAALAGLRVDNCYVEVDAPEPPGLDGSARLFVDVLERAGFEAQSAFKTIWTVRSSVVVAHGGATLALHPHDGHELRASYLLDYGDDSPICPQRHTVDVTPGSFARGLAGCRTFLLEHEAYELMRQGIGKRTRVTDLLVFGPRGPIANRLRFADEPARHKLLDLIGDLSLLGEDVRGHVVAYRSGHPLNVELVRALAQQMGRTNGLRRLAA